MTDVSITYGEGGYDPQRPLDNIVDQWEQDIDDDGLPVGEPCWIIRNGKKV